MADTVWPVHLFCSAIAIPYFLLLGSDPNFLTKDMMNRLFNGLLICRIYVSIVIVLSEFKHSLLVIYIWQIMLVKYIKLPGEMKNKGETKKAASQPCSLSLLPTPALSSPVPKTNAKTVLRYIRQKYLNASRRKNDLHLQRSLSSQNQNTLPEVCWCPIG